MQVEDRIIQEDTVRQLRLRHKKTELVVCSDAYLTPGALEYIKQNRIILTVADRPTVNTDIRPQQKSAGTVYVTQDGCALAEKPEHMTHLYGNVLVDKTHPRITLRGKLDSLQADIVELQTACAGAVVDELEDILQFCRKLLACEVTGKPMPEMRLLNLSASELREQSQNPRTYFARGHILPGHWMGQPGAALNRLRAQCREVELAAARAFCSSDGTVSRAEILLGLNRLSSAFYIMMFRHTSDNGEEGGCGDG